MIKHLYHLVAVNVKSGFKAYLTAAPQTHEKCMTQKSKCTVHPSRVITVEAHSKLSVCNKCSGCGFMNVYDPGHYDPDKVMPDDEVCDECNGSGVLK